MITRKNLKDLLRYLGFSEEGDEFVKNFPDIDAYLKVDFAGQKLIYPEDKGLRVNERQTCNFSANENFVVFETVHRLFEKGYKPEHIELEPKWKLGRGASGGRADIWVKDFEGKSLLIIECKTPGREFRKAWKRMLIDGGQLFSYAQQARDTKFLCLYASDFDGDTLTYENYIVTLVDNDRLLEERKASFPLAYRDATSTEDLFRAWKETYAQDYMTVGIFEEGIQAYEIGKSKYTIQDLRPVAQQDIQPKYHEFATILRQHNVSGRENAFDKLVNLFLCKIVDEIQHPSDLQFYWKGIAYDSLFDLVDRLQRLYRDGMKKFLKEEVTYIDNQTIQDAFKFFKNDPDATRDKILEYFRQQKYFTNNDFAFIDVHNESLFYQNAAVLLKIVQMLQGMRLTGNNSHNQFLGDMFEFFLDQGFKQTEGQFFTPLPIVRFILMSLPLPYLIENDTEPPPAVDYACGAGHFLTELALQIKPFVEGMGRNPHNYYAAIYGIEKEYRLSKVAKVSTFMYGQGEINVIYADALTQHPQIKEGEFRVLVSNPPYSVKGFLETLPEAERARYELIEVIDEKSYPTNNSIESFFIERAKQLLAPGGIAAIIAPTSVLSNADRVYTHTREILLRFFDIVALVEFPGGTFGKTGTNTVTLFLRRKDDNPAPAAHYRNRVEAWFKGDRDKDNVFQDGHLLRAYCEHIGISFDDYRTLLEGQPNSALLETEIFRAYRQAFENSTEIKHLREKSSFKEKSEAERQAELNSRFLNYVRTVEKDKVYYFLLAYTQPNPVVIVRGPNGTRARKAFLGYEWSSRKGDEGIKILTDANGKHLTPLYDPDDRDNPEKINFFIQRNFIGERPEVPEVLRSYLSFARLVDLLDFGQVKFDKQISTTCKMEMELTSDKWKLQAIGSLCVLEYGKGLPEDLRVSGPYPVMGANGRVGFHNEYIVEGPTIIIGRKGSAGSVVWEENNCWPIDTTFYVRLKSQEVSLKYLYIVLSNLGLEKIGGGLGVPGLSRSEVYSIKIPVPPLEVQRQIVAECQAIDDEVAQAKQELQRQRSRLLEIIREAASSARKKPLGQVVDRIRETVNPQQEQGRVFYVGLENMEGHTGRLLVPPEVEFSTIKSAKNKFQKGDILYGKLRPNLNKVWLADREGICSTDILVLRPHSENQALFYAKYLLTPEFNQAVLATVSGQQLPRTSWNKIRDIPVPELSEEQAAMVADELRSVDARIAEAYSVIASAERRKRAVLEKYL